MQYEIQGDMLPVIECSLREGETIICQNGAMSWMSSNMKMETSAGGSFKKMLSRSVTGASIFLNKYTPQNSEGMIAFASSMPGSIITVKIDSEHELFCRSGSFLACTEGVHLDMDFNNRSSNNSFGNRLKLGVFGGSGLFMQHFTGEGLAILEIDGTIVEKDLADGEQIVIDNSGYLVAIDKTCTIDVRRVKGAKNIFLGGEGLFNVVVTGPGHIIMQTMPIAKLGGTIASEVSRANRPWFMKLLALFS